MKKIHPSFHIHYAWIILTVGTFIVAGSLGLARFGYSLVLPQMQSSLHLDNTGAGGLATANLIGYLLLALIGGALSARFGARKVIVLGMVLAGVGMICTGLSSSFWSAMIWRALTGVGSGASNVPTMGFLSSWFGLHYRGLATGIAVSGASIALIVTGPLVPRILSKFPDNGWRITWYIFGGISLLLAFIGATLLQNRPEERGLRPLGETEKNVNAGEDAQGGLQWSLVYLSPRVWHLGILYATFGFSYIIYITFFIRYLIGEVGYSSIAAGNLFMLMGWFSMVCGLVWGTLSDRIGRRMALVMVFKIQAISYIMFAIWPQPAGLVLSAIFFGITAWSIPAIMAATCGDMVGDRLSSAALGFVTLFMGIGQALGPSIAGMIADSTGSFTHAFFLASALAFTGGIGSYFLKLSNP
jgi:MFS family permease